MKYDFFVNIAIKDSKKHQNFFSLHCIIRPQKAKIKSARYTALRYPQFRKKEP